MAIIAINRFYAPDHSATSQLLTDLAEHLAEMGQEVRVITSRLTYDRTDARLPSSEHRGGVLVERVWTPGFARHRLLGRLVDYAAFYVLASWKLLRRARPGDTVIVKTDPPLMSVPASWIAHIRKARLVNWCQDLFPETATALGVRGMRGKLADCLRWLRNGSLRHAQHNVVLCDAMRARLLNEGIPASKIEIIHNWCDKDIRPTDRQPDIGPDAVIGYSGNLGRAHMPETVLRLLRQCAEDEALAGVTWRFTGGGYGMSYMRREVAGDASLCNRVVFEPYRPLAELSRSLGASDLHLVVLDPACEGLIMPSKLYGILACGRPVLFLGAQDGAVAELIREFDIGLTLDVENSAGWVGQLRQFLKRSETAPSLANSIRSLFEREFAAERAFEKWRSFWPLKAKADVI